LQKARETGDPTYYQKTEEALEKALSFQPADYASISAKGALALARHDFSSALVWGEKAKQINPSRTYAYGVIADAQIELGRYEEAIVTLQTMVDYGDVVALGAQCLAVARAPHGVEASITSVAVSVFTQAAMEHGERHALEGAVASVWWAAYESARLREVDPIEEAAAVCRYVARVA
jgi:tetratricopeptide (TPR) repeat protein